MRGAVEVGQVIGRSVPSSGGSFAGTDWPTRGNILIGAFTRAPDWKVSNFVNIGNTICFWRDTEKTAPCPPPITPKECGAAH
jgi:hypothetical protein